MLLISKFRKFVCPKRYKLNLQLNMNVKCEQRQTDCLVAGPLMIELNKRGAEREMHVKYVYYIYARAFLNCSNNYLNLDKYGYLSVKKKIWVDTLRNKKKKVEILG